MSERTYCLTEREMDALIEKSAHYGAKRALSDLGLQDENAARDMKDVRDILGGYRVAKKGFLSMIGKLIALAIIALFGFGIYVTGGKLE